MEEGLFLSNIQEYIKKTEESFRHQECNTCECYLGYLTQLKIDADQEGQQHLQEYVPDKNQIHACPGCDPCPPGILYSNYLRKRSSG